MNSALYLGSVRHRRHEPLQDEFRYPLFMAYLDLDELPELFDGRWLWSARRPAPAWFRRADYLGDARRGLAEEVSSLVAERTGRPAEGPIRLLTHLRYFGHCFNPVSFYYCFRADGAGISNVIADVTNTPWGERHAYLMPADGRDTGVIEGTARKRLHVSPLMGMDHLYSWRLTEPGARLAVHIESSDGEGRPVFDATLALRRREMSPGEMRRVLARYPFLTARILTRIYAHALRLRLRGARYFPHPGRGALPA